MVQTVLRACGGHPAAMSERAVDGRISDAVERHVVARRWRSPAATLALITLLLAVLGSTSWSWIAGRPRLLRPGAEGCFRSACSETSRSRWQRFVVIPGGVQKRVRASGGGRCSGG